jgi:hypothetical protein
VGTLPALNPKDDPAGLLLGSTPTSLSAAAVSGTLADKRIDAQIYLCHFVFLALWVED